MNSGFEFLEMGSTVFDTGETSDIRCIKMCDCPDSETLNVIRIQT